MPSPHPSSVELAERLGAIAAVATVARTERVSPTIMEVTLEHEHALQLAGVPGNDVMVRLEEPGHSVRRRYSVRRVDADRRSLDLWVTTAHRGPGSNWVTGLQPGDEVDLLGPRGKIPVAADADWHLFVGDTPMLGAAYRMVESLSGLQRALVVAEVDTPEDALAPLDSGEVRVGGAVICRNDRERSDAAGLLNALAAVDLPGGAGRAYLFSEYHVGRVIRSALLDRGLEDDRISVKAFWRSGRSNAEHGEPPKD